MVDIRMVITGIGLGTIKQLTAKNCYQIRPLRIGTEPNLWSLILPLIWVSQKILILIYQRDV